MPALASAVAEDLLRASSLLLHRARYPEAWERCEALMLAAPTWWKAQAVKARILLEWGKADGDDERLEKSVDAFNVTLAIIRQEEAAKKARAAANERSSATNDDATENTAPSENDNASSLSTSDAEDEEVALELIELHNDRGVALLELDEMADARAAFETTLELHPDHDRALCNLGLVHWAEGRERVALRTFDRAVEANAQNAHSFNNRGALRLEWGDWAASLPDFHTALKIEPFYEVISSHASSQSAHTCLFCMHSSRATPHAPPLHSALLHSLSAVRCTSHRWRGATATRHSPSCASPCR